VRRWVRIAKLPLVLMLCSTFACNAEDVRTAKELTFQDIFATRAGDARQYILLGGGWLRTTEFG
jgi:hypothetical protein